MKIFYLFLAKNSKKITIIINLIKKRRKKMTKYIEN
jgi:hypothetical protein